MFLVPSVEPVCSWRSRQTMKSQWNRFVHQLFSSFEILFKLFFEKHLLLQWNGIIALNIVWCHVTILIFIQIGIDMKYFPTFKSDLDFTASLVSEQSVFCLPGKVSFNYFMQIIHKSISVIVVKFLLKILLVYSWGRSHAVGPLLMEDLCLVIHQSQRRLIGHFVILYQSMVYRANGSGLSSRVVWYTQKSVWECVQMLTPAQVVGSSLKEGVPEWCVHNFQLFFANGKIKWELHKLSLCKRSF